MTTPGWASSGLVAPPAEERLRFFGFQDRRLCSLFSLGASLGPATAFLVSVSEVADNRSACSILHCVFDFSKYASSALPRPHGR
jgi:hypothetical protein